MTHLTSQSFISGNSHKLHCWLHIFISSTLLSISLAGSSLFTSALTDHSNLEDLDLYKITWKGPIPNGQLLPEHDEIKYNEDNVIEISTQNQDRYRCIVPDNVDHLNFDVSAKNASSDEKKISAVQILEPLFKGEVCSYKFELFWIYELCHGKYLRQYHEANAAKQSTKITQEYYLGRTDAEQIKEHHVEYEQQMEELRRSGATRPTVLIDGHHKPYVTFNMTGGTKCDLTKRNRNTRVIYVCGSEPNHVLYSIKEISTCEYEALVLSPLLCAHKDFKIDSSARHEIKCYSIDGAPRRPEKALNEEEEEEELVKDAQKKQAYFQGRTLIINADLLFNELTD